MKHLFCFILGIVSVHLPGQQIYPLWQLQESTDCNIDAYTPLVLVDSFHNIITCGTTYTPGPATGFITFKYDQNGNKLWERRHQTSATDFITAAATDSEGAVYVGGVTINNPLGGVGNQVIFKYSTEGDTLWQYYLQVEKGVSSSISTLLLDDDRNLLIFGAYFDTIQNKGGLFVQKKATDGTLLWTATHVESDYGYSAQNAIWNGDRWIFWGRNSSSIAGGTRLLCWQIGPEGQTLAAAASALNPEIIFPLHIDRKGNLYLTHGNDYKVIKYSTSAERQWEYLNPAMVFPPFVVAARMEALITDQDLNIYASGMIRIDSVHIDPITTKISDQGEVIWEHHLSPLESGAKNFFPEQCTLLTQDHMLVSGIIITNPDSNFYEPFFVVYSTNGFINAIYNDIEGRKNEINAVVLDSPSFYATGVSFKESVQGVTKQFLCKYSIHDLISTLSSESKLESSGQMTITPNPFFDHCSILFDHAGESRSGVIQISNAQGIVVFSQEVALSFGSQSIELNAFVHFPAGVYQVSILTDGRLYSAKVVKAP